MSAEVWSVVPPKTIDSREAYMKGEGFILFTDVGEQLLDYLSRQPVEQLTQQSKYNYMGHAGRQSGLHAANMGLLGVINTFMDQIPNRGHDQDPIDSQLKERPYSNKRCEFYGINDVERRRAAKHTYDVGLDDLDLPWHFSAALANATVNSFVSGGWIKQEEAAALTIGDWADVIGSGWFASLTHSFALTGFGVVKSYGKETKHFNPQSLGLLLNAASEKYGVYPEEEAPILVVSEKEEPNEGQVYLTASVHPEYKKVLRIMRQYSAHLNYRVEDNKSIGCPVARKSAMLPWDYANSMPRAQKLQELGCLSIGESVNEKGEVLATQEYTEIDRTLGFIADQLRAYDGTYGTPQLDGDRRLTHAYLPPTGILCRAA